MTENKYALLVMEIPDYEYTPPTPGSFPKKMIADILRNNFDGTFSRLAQSVDLDAAREMVAALNE